MAVMTALPTFRHEGKPFLAFVYGICAHKVADAHRAAARSRSHPVADVPDAPRPSAAPSSGGRQLDRGGDRRCWHACPRRSRRSSDCGSSSGSAPRRPPKPSAMTAGAVRVSQHRALAKLRHLLSTDAALSEQLVLMAGRPEVRSPAAEPQFAPRRSRRRVRRRRMAGRYCHPTVDVSADVVSGRCSASIPHRTALCRVRLGHPAEPGSADRALRELARRTVAGATAGTTAAR